MTCTKLLVVTIASNIGMQYTLPSNNNSAIKPIVWVNLSHILKFTTTAPLFLWIAFSSTGKLCLNLADEDQFPVGIINLMTIKSYS